MLHQGETAMPMTALRLFACACLAAGTCPAAAEPSDMREALSTLSGSYASIGPEAWYGGHGRRLFTFDAGSWTLDFTFGLDPALESPVFRFRTGGDYRIEGPSQAVPGAWQAVFDEDRKLLTLLTGDEGLAEAMGLAACGLVPGVETDISQTGCASWRPVADCPEDHDLLAMEPNGDLRFGVRPADNDMCTAARRPTALLNDVVRRQ